MPDKFYPYYEFPINIDSNWKKLYDVATSYKKAVSALIASETQECSCYSERDIFPIFTLIHVYLELIFKSLLFQKKEIPKTSHDLICLREQVRELHPSLIFAKHEEEFIKFLSRENPKAAAFRYNFDKFWKECFKLKNENFGL